MGDNHGNELPIEPTKSSPSRTEWRRMVFGFWRSPNEKPDGQRELDHHHVARDLTFLGLKGMMDPPRPEAIAAVRRCQNAGIAVKMITGDHLLTARTIAQQIGLRGGSNQRRRMQSVVANWKEPAMKTCRDRGGARQFLPE